MNKISNGAKIGLFIEMLAGIIMAVLVIAGKTIPAVVAWLFMVGLIIALASSLMEYKR